MFLLLGLSILAASVNSLVLHKVRASKKSTIFRFNLYCSLVWCVILFFVSKGNISINCDVLLWGFLYGIVQALFILFKTLAMSSGSVSISTLIGNSSLIISIAVSRILWKEPVSVPQVICVALLLFSIFLCTYKKSDAEYKPGWKYYVTLFLITAASVGIIFKAFSKAADGAYSNSMMFVSALVMAACYLLLSIVSGSFRPKNKPAGRRFLLYALSAGILSCLYNRLNIYLSGALDAIIFFPTFNGGVILLSAVLSIVTFKEKLRKKQIVGLLIGTAAICAANIL